MAKDTTGGTLLSNSPETHSSVPSPPRQITRSIWLWRSLRENVFEIDVFIRLHTLMRVSHVNMHVAPFFLRGGPRATYSKQPHRLLLHDLQQNASTQAAFQIRVAYEDAS